MNNLGRKDILFPNWQLMTMNLCHCFYFHLLHSVFTNIPVVKFKMLKLKTIIHRNRIITFSTMCISYSGKGYFFIAVSNP